MSDQTAPVANDATENDIRDATEALRLISAKTGDSPCPMCGNKDWFIESRHGHIGVPSTVFHLKDRQPVPEKTPAMPVIALSCTECGFVRTHNIAVITGRIYEL